MSLKADKYDPTEEIVRLNKELGYYLGGPSLRMAQPELSAFLYEAVGDALVRAFRQAESLYIDDMVKQASQSSQNMLNAVFAGVTLAEHHAEKEAE